MSSPGTRKRAEVVVHLVAAPDMRSNFVIRSLAIALCALAYSTLLTGCTVCQNARFLMRVEPREFSAKHDKKRSLRLYRAWAERAIEEELAFFDELQDFDYRVGFCDGFVDFVYAGGKGEPPAIPPRQYWNVDLRSPDGHNRAEQWFAGFRHGKRVADEGGYRSLVVIRGSLSGVDPSIDLPSVYSDTKYFDQSESLRIPDAELPLPELHGMPSDSSKSTTIGHNNIAANLAISPPPQTESLSEKDLQVFVRF